jgi:hypothetical protein
MGVRIGVKNRDFFSGNAYYQCDTIDVYFEDEIISSDNIPKKIIRLNNGYVQLDGPHKLDVLYADNDLKKSYVKNQQSEGLSLQLVNPYIMLGIKGEAWKFESETRFFITLTLHDRLNIEYLYLGLSDKFFEDLEITFNPFIKEDEKEKIREDIKEKLNTSLNNPIQFKNSELDGKIRLT